MKDFVGRYGRIWLRRLLGLGALAAVLGLAALLAAALTLDGQIASRTPLFLLYSTASLAATAWVAGLMYGLLPALFRLSLTIAAGLLPKLFTAALGLMWAGSVASLALLLYGPRASFVVVASPLLVTWGLGGLATLGLAFAYRGWYRGQEGRRAHTLAAYAKFKVGKRPEQLERLESFLRSEFGTTTSVPVPTALEPGEVDPADATKIRELEDAHRIVGAINPYQEPKRPPCFPGLEQRPWYDVAAFPWVKELEARADEIRAEALEAFAMSKFSPYEYPGVGNKGWQYFWLMEGGRPHEENLRRCPATASAIAHLPRTQGEIAFALLAPNTGLAAHRDCGTSVLSIHLGLVVPEKCSIRVGGETKTWVEGKAIIFDPSFEHEVMNASDRPRIILLADFNHPGLTEVENDFFELIGGF